MGKKSYETSAEQILQLVGGKENIVSFRHCMTRLRFTVKDKALVKDEEIKKLADVVGTQWFGEQLQVIIGTDVDDIYQKICDLSGIKPETTISENLDGNLVSQGGNVVTKVINALAKSVLPVIDIIVPCAFLMMILSILGSSGLGILADDSDLYQLLTFVSNAGFYFMPIFMGYSAAKTFNASPFLGAFLGAVMVSPTLIEIVSTGTGFTVYGIPMALVSYTSTSIPIFITVWVMSYVERFFRKRLPASLAPTFAPLFIIVVMLPIELCVVGPIGSWIGTGFISAVTWLAAKGAIAGFLVTTIIGGVWVYTVLFGFNMPVFMLALELLNTNGVDKVIFPGVICAFYALIGITLGAFIKFVKIKRNDESGKCLTYFITLGIGGISEPAIYGVGVRFKKPFLFMCIGGAIGAAVSSLLQAYVYTAVAHSGFLAVLGFLGGSSMNTVLGIISAVISLIIAAVLTYLFGIDTKDLEA